LADSKVHYPRNDEITKELLSVFGIPLECKVTKVQLTMEVGCITTITVEHYATDDQVGELAKTLKNYVIM